MIGVEPEAGDDTRRSLEAGERVRIPVPRTIADGQQADIPGELTFEVNRHVVDDVVTVSDSEIVDAMGFLFDRMKLVTEPSGASAAAALLAGRAETTGARVGRHHLGRQRRRVPFRRTDRGSMSSPPRHGAAPHILRGRDPGRPRLQGG